jgi:hypothetical protein
VHVDPVVMSLRATIERQVALGAGDPAVEAAAERLADALGPALRQAAIELAQQAAVEIGAQLHDRSIDVVLSGDDLELRVVDAPTSLPAPSVEDLDARITLRLPPSLKSTIEKYANIDGESVNSWVIDALSKGARRHDATGRRVTEDFDL